MSTIEVDDTIRVNKPGHAYHGRLAEVEQVYDGGSLSTVPPFVSVSISSSGFGGGNGGWSFRYTGFDLAPHEVTLVRKGNQVLDEITALFARMDSAAATHAG